MPDEQEAWAFFERRYSSIAHWLLQFKKEATKRTDKGDYWWELRACEDYSEFSQPKLFNQTFQVRRVLFLATSLCSVTIQCGLSLFKTKHCLPSYAQTWAGGLFPSIALAYRTAIS